MTSAFRHLSFRMVSALEAAQILREQHGNAPAVTVQYEAGKLSALERAQQLRREAMPQASKHEVTTSLSKSQVTGRFRS